MLARRAARESWGNGSSAVCMACIFGAIGQADEDAIQGGDFVGAGSFGTKEMACATRVGDGSGLGGSN